MTYNLAALIPPCEEDVYVYRARLKRVVDGDTVILDISEGFGQWLTDERCRLSGIDAAELTGPTKVLGAAAREHLAQLLPPVGETFLVRSLKDKRCKWGRYMIEIWVDGECVNLQMIRDGYAVPTRAG
jgi:endonuclease YncB( thermonuclease family)